MPRKFSYPIKRSPKSDPQQYRVYRMENEAIGARCYMQMSRTAMRALAAMVCRNYRVPQVRLTWKDLGRWAAQWLEPSAIELSNSKGSARDILTITHELAHHIHHHLSGGADEHQQNHGAQFMACHMSILDTCRVIPVVGMKAICDDYGIAYFDPGRGGSLARLRSICRKKR